MANGVLILAEVDGGNVAPVTSSWSARRSG